MLPLYRVFNLFKLHDLNRSLAFYACYSGTRPLQRAIDEEGCGAVFCAARLTPERAES